MESVLVWNAVAGIIAVAVFYVVSRRLKNPRPVLSRVLKPGNLLPDFEALDENGKPVHSRELLGAPAVILFVRGNWCPFCSRQVEELTAHYREIVALGAKLIFVAPKPLQTTRRVAEFFEVEFDFWLDESLSVARQLGLVQTGAVPEEHRGEYGEDSVWPTALVVDSNGTIRNAQLSRFIADRPQPAQLLHALRQITGSD
jgi:peroxiredoxin